MGDPDFDALGERLHAALGEFVRGNGDPIKGLFSHRDDVTFANPFGPLVHSGWKDVSDTVDGASANFRDGRIEFERIATYATPGLTCIVELERIQAKVGPAEDLKSFRFRGTSLFRVEDGAWKLAHAHVNALIEPRPVESVAER